MTSMRGSSGGPTSKTSEHASIPRGNSATRSWILEQRPIQRTRAHALTALRSAIDAELLVDSL